jgi:DNA-binding transcriptional LysR family regulator
MRSLNLDQLRALETVIEMASFTAAAKRLNLSQSTVSVQIRELEKRFGVRLVDRVGKRAAPTAAGRELIEHTRRISLGIETAAQAMQRHKDGALGEVKVGATSTALTYFLAPILKVLRRQHPDIQLSIHFDTTVGQVESLLDDEIDFGIVNLPVKERLIHVVPLRTEQLVAVFPADTPGVPRSVSPEYLARHRLLLEALQNAHVKTLVLDWLSPATRQLRPAMLLDNFDTIARMVAVGLGASVIPEMVLEASPLKSELIVRPLTPKLHRTLGLIVHKDKVPDRAMRIFREAVTGGKG